MTTNIINQNILDSYTKDSIRYAMEVNKLRAIPNIKDGLKVVQRRIIDIMIHHEKCIYPSVVKSASITGKVVAISHPHGDVAVYDTMKPMTNWWDIKVPYLIGQGSWGTVEGDEQAAQRYTNTSLSPFTIDCVIGDLLESKNVVDWNPTYDDRNLEPAYFPVKLPLLLIQGCTGIGYGIKVDVPKHNLAEVVDATIALMHDPNINIVLIPDQCMPVQIIDTDWNTICNTGNGKYTARGIIDIETDRDGSPILVIKSTVDGVNLINIVAKLDKLHADKDLISVVDLRDETVGDNMRFVIKLKKGADPNYMREYIYKKTDMQKTCLVNFEVLDGLENVRLSYKEYLQSFIHNAMINKFRLFTGRLQTLNTRLHQRSTYIQLLESGRIDEVIQKIRRNTGSDDEKLSDWLVREFKISPVQASYILNANIKQLSVGYLNKYKKEQSDCIKSITEYTNILTDDNKIKNIIIEELLEFKKKYGRPRTSVLINPKDVSEVPAGEFKVIVTMNNFIKKVHLNDIISTSKNDMPKIVLKCDNRENILIFDRSGRAFKLAVSAIPMADKNSSGVDIRLLVKNLTSDICNVIYEPLLVNLSKQQNKYFLTTITRSGLIKKIDLMDLSTIPPSGIAVAKLGEGDSIQSVKITFNSSDIVIYSHSKALRINVNDIPLYKRYTIGVQSITSGLVDDFTVLANNVDNIIVVTQNGKVNKFHVSGLPLSTRGKSGNKVIKLSKGDAIKSIVGANDNDILIVFTMNGKLEIPVSTIPLGSSIGDGEKMIVLKNDNIIRVEVKRI